MSGAGFFSSTVPQAEARFSRACETLGLEVSAFAHPCSDPEGHPIHTLAAMAGSPDAPDRLVVISGTHGIEGYAGSAIQAGLLEQIDWSSLPANLAVLFVHLINPWGCAWDRREDHENIDVFRNLLYGEPPFAANPLYDEIAAALCPPQWDGSARAQADAGLQAYEARNGPGAVIAAARGGQHDHPKGMTYHGRGPSWSRRTMDAIAGRFLQGARRIVNYDIHTGYGDYGQGVVVSFEPGPSAVHERIVACFGPDLLTLGQDPILPAHPGAPYDYLRRLVPEAEITSFALEFGTVNVSDSFDLLREASWLFNYGDPTSEQGREIRARYRAAFHVEADDWMEMVWTRGLDVFLQAADCLMQAPLQPRPIR